MSDLGQYRDDTIDRAILQRPAGLPSRRPTILGNPCCRSALQTIAHTLFAVRNRDDHKREFLFDLTTPRSRGILARKRALGWLRPPRFRTLSQRAVVSRPGTCTYSALDRHWGEYDGRSECRSMSEVPRFNELAFHSGSRRAGGEGLLCLCL